MEKIKKEKKLHSDKSENLIPWLFSALWIIGFLVFSLYPIIQSFIFSFEKINVTTNGFVQTGIGLENFRAALFDDVDFRDAIQTYLIQMLVEITIIMVVSLILALLLNAIKRCKGFFRTLFFLPVIITSGPVIKMFITNGMASFPGVSTLIDYDQLATMVPMFIVTLVKTLMESFIMILWFSGIQTLVFLTGLQKLDKSMYEAAKIDGAGAWESFWKITLPALNPVLVLNAIFTVVMQSMFSLNPIISKIASDMTDTNKGYGYACAEAWIFFIILLLVLGITVLIFMRKPHRRRRGD